MVHPVYVASKVVHAPKWIEARDRGLPISSTWIDEAQPGQTRDWADLWKRCVSEASNSPYILAYREEGEVLKGALVEIGAALAAGGIVIGVGCGDYSFRHHRFFREMDTLDEALAFLLRAQRDSWPAWELLPI